MTARVAATAEFDAIARLAAATLDAPIATVSAFEHGVSVRLGARGVPWPPGDEDALLRIVAERGGGEPATLDLAALPSATRLVADGARTACTVALRDAGAALGVLAVYGPGDLAPSLVAQRRLLDLAAVTGEMIRSRLQTRALAAGERDVRLAGALGALLRAADWRASLKIAIEALSTSRATHWVVRGVTLEHGGSWDRSGRSTPSEVVATAAPALVRALADCEVIASGDARVDPRLAELAAYHGAGHVVGQLIAAIRHRNRIIAAIAFEDAEPRHWTPGERQFCAAIAGWLGPLLALADDGKSLDIAEHHVLELVERTTDRVLIADRDGRIVHANPSAAALWRTPGDVVGRSLGELNPPELRHLPGLDRFRRTGHDPMLEEPFVRRIASPGGPERLLEISLTKYTLHGAPYIGAIVRDVGATANRFEATMAGVAAAIGHVSLDGQFLRFNARLLDLLGRTAAELRPFAQGVDRAPPPDRPGLSVVDAFGLVGQLELGALRSRLVASQQPHRIDLVVTRPDGARRWIELTFALAVAPDGEPGYFVISAVDGTAHHRAGAALRELADVLSLTGSELYSRVCAYLGTTLGARAVHIGRLQDHTVEPIAVWQGGAPVVAPPYALLGTPCEHVLRAGPCYFSDRIRALFPRDRMLAELGVNSYLGAPLRDGDGTVIGVIAVFGDGPFDAAIPVDDLVQLSATRVAAALQRGEAMRELAQREEQLRQITETAHETFWLAHWPSRELIYVSPAFELLTGRSLASLYADRGSWGLGLHPDDRERIDAAMMRLEGGPADETARVIHSDGQLRWVQIRAAVIRDRDGRPYRIAGTLEDITRIKATQLALEERERELAAALASSEREVEELHVRLGEEQMHGMVGGSPAIRGALRRLRQAAQSDVTVLIAGESGTGKELAAHALHAMSSRRSRPFVAINCAAIPEPLLESELFGHVKGAFTGAARDKVGLMQAAGGGTLFLDEIGDMSPVLQAKLLRALQERQVRRVGDENAIAVDVRLVSASHRDLRALVATGRMREDFYYRIKVFEIAVPALRDRREDIPALANHFTVEFCLAAGKPPVMMAADALRALLNHHWPGNVRELRNAIEHALVTVSGGTIQLDDLPIEIRNTEAGAPAAPPPEPVAAPVPRAAEARAALTPEAQRRGIEDALRRSGGNRVAAARLLGVGRVTLWKRMRRLGMTAEDAAAPDDASEDPDDAGNPSREPH